MENQAIKDQKQEESCTPQTISEAIFLDLASTESAQSGDSSYTVLGQIKSYRHERLRRKKPFVQKIFIDFVGRLSPDALQQLCYLNFYQELCSSLRPSLKNRSGAAKEGGAFSPYFIDGQKNEQKRHKTLKQRFCLLAQRRTIRLQPKEPFQLACTLENLWEAALHLSDGGKAQSAQAKILAEKLVEQAKKLPKSYCLFLEKKDFVHISSLKMTRPTKRRLSSNQQNLVQEFLVTLLSFGYEYYNLVSA